MALDLTLILYLTFFRKALTKISPEMSTLLIVHVLLALSTVVGYVLIVRAGLKLMKGDENSRLTMRRLDRIVMPLRVLVLLTSTWLAFAR